MLMINHRSEKSEPLSCQPVSNFRTGFMSTGVKLQNWFHVELRQSNSKTGFVSDSGSQIQKLVSCQTQVVKFKNQFHVRLRQSNSKTGFVSDSGSQIQKPVSCQTQVVKFKNWFRVRLRQSNSKTGFISNTGIRILKNSSQSIHLRTTFPIHLSKTIKSTKYDQKYPLKI